MGIYRGDVILYDDRRDADGELRTWSPGSVCAQFELFLSATADGDGFDIRPSRMSEDRVRRSANTNASDVLLTYVYIE